MGHLTFFDSKTKNIVLFGGQRSGDNFKSSNQRLLQNDVVIFDYKNNHIVEHITFSEGHVQGRMYHVGFKIGSSIYSIGGMANSGALIEGI